MSVPMYAGMCSGMYACTWRARDVGIYRHRVSCYIHTYRTTAKRSAKRSQDGPPHLPAATAATGAEPVCAAASSGADRCSGFRPAPSVRAARWPGASESPASAADERTPAKRSRPRAAQVRVSTHGGTLRTRHGVLCVLTPAVCGSVLVSFPASTVGGGCGGAGAPAICVGVAVNARMCAREAVHTHPGRSRVSPVRPHAAESHPWSRAPGNAHGRCKRP